MDVLRTTRRFDPAESAIHVDYDGKDLEILSPVLFMTVRRKLLGPTR